MRRYSAVFSACWILGLIGGAFTAVRVPLFFIPLMHRYSVLPASIVLFLMAFLPFLITAAAVLFHRQSVLFLCAGLAGFLLSVLGQSVHLSFGTAGWLFGPMVMFSGTVTAAVYLWFGLRCCPGSAVKDLFTCLLIILAAVVIDMIAVSPFLAALLHY